MGTINTSVPALTPQPLSVSAAPAQPPLYSKLEDSKFRLQDSTPIDLHSFHHPTCIVSPEQASQPAPMTTRSGRSESVDDFMDRLERCFKKFSGISQTENSENYHSQLKAALVLGLNSALSETVVWDRSQPPYRL
ncbi:hypothetical protein DPEC_G00206070 [Dallia pectoralis]|uniref:Uncharacterized protein n=1 Tax=Dallia pectoralis TaxID=75939 RepID=A0ACC2G4U8_DALPE|nr:hypothetical protein DPEC_G00206070 [Dallia pectoralis]